MLPRVRGPVAAALLMFLALTPRTSEGQMGKLLKKAKDKAADAATKAVDAVGTDKDKAAAAKAGVPGGSASSAPVMLEVTSDNLDMFIAVMKSDIARYGPRLEYARKANARKACLEAAMKDPTSLMQGDRNEAEEAKANTRIVELTNALTAASKAQQSDRFAAINDSLQYAVEVQNYWQIPGLRKCGMPVAPPPGGLEGKVPGPAPVLPDGITVNQYGLLRERIAAWLLSKGKLGAPLLKPAETELLAQRVNELTPFTDYFRNGVVAWLEWQDVAQWSQ